MSDSEAKSLVVDDRFDYAMGYFGRISK